MIQILIPSGLQVCITALSKPLGRKGKHACFSKADAKVQHFFHICKYFTKKHAFFDNLCHFLQYEYYKRRQERINQALKTSKTVTDIPTSSFYLIFLPNIIRAYNIHARIRAVNNPHKQRIMQIKIKKQQKSLEMSKKIRIFAADYCEYTNRLWQNDHQNPAMRVKTNS